MKNLWNSLCRVLLVIAGSVVSAYLYSWISSLYGNVQSVFLGAVLVGASAGVLAVAWIFEEKKKTQLLAAALMGAGGAGAGWDHCRFLVEFSETSIPWLLLTSLFSLCTLAVFLSFLASWKFGAGPRLAVVIPGLTCLVMGLTVAYYWNTAIRNIISEDVVWIMPYALAGVGMASCFFGFVLGGLWLDRKINLSE